jgi:hypothetical protein
MYGIGDGFPSANMLRRKHSWHVQKVAALTKKLVAILGMRKTPVPTMKEGCIPSEINIPPGVALWE